MMRVHAIAAVLAACLFVEAALPVSAAEPYRKVGKAQRGMVVATSGAASAAGVEVLREGGNAVDAAVTTAFTLAVTFPWAGNLAGGGFAVVHLADGRAFTLDFRETAPARAHRDMYLDGNGGVIDSLSLYSHLAVGVPGSVDGLLRLWEDHGSGVIPRARLFEDAITLAREGFAIDQDLADRLNSERKQLAEDGGAAAIFIRDDGREWRPGDVLVQPDLANALVRIAREGRDGFYAGETAARIAEEMRGGNGLVGLDDLAAYRSRYREPVRGSFRGYDILSMGPPSSGGVLVIHLLNMLDGFPLVRFGHNSADYVHVFAECARRAYADRAEHLGDPDFWEVPLVQLASRDYARLRARNISLARATPSAAVSAGVMPPPESPETTHLSVVDAAGNAVSLTTTLNAGFGSCLVVDGTGILLNNEMDDFSAKPGVANLYGLVGNEANAIAPGKRMLSSMSPTIVLRDGAPYLVLGSPGGSRIITSVLQVILNTVVFGMPVADAVAMPRVHAQWLPDVLYHEPYGLAPEVIRGLKGRGHDVRLRTTGPIGRVNAIQILEDGLYGGPDTRGAGAAVGY